MHRRKRTAADPSAKSLQRGEPENCSADSQHDPCQSRKGFSDLRTTNLEIELESTLKANVEESGTTTIPAKSLLALVSKELQEHYSMRKR